jgi:hypothetical protein
MIQSIVPLAPVRSWAVIPESRISLTEGSHFDWRSYGSNSDEMRVSGE